MQARQEPSFQLAGRELDDHRGADIDLGTLREAGVELTGRLREFSGRHATFADDLSLSARDADVRQARFLDAVDDHVEGHHLADEVDPVSRPAPLCLGGSRERIDLLTEGIGTVVLATGYAPHHPWLKVPVVGPGGAIRQVRGATPAPGLYVVGQRFQHRRDSATIDGARHDAHDVVSHIFSPTTRAALESLELR